MLITLEGIEGAGKSTHLPYIQKLLEQAEHQVCASREPGGTMVGEAIRKILLNADSSLTQETELLLLFAARAQHFTEVIQPAMQSDKICICDRFTDSSYAYQGGGREIATERIAILETWLLGNFRPHLTLLFDIDVDTSRQRIQQRLTTDDRYEQEKKAFFERARQCYLKLAKQEPQRYRVIDACQSIDKVQQDIQTILKAEGLC